MFASEGDWSWMKQAHNLNGWEQGKNKNVCFLCPANCSDKPFTDPSLRAQWRRFPRWTNSTYITTQLQQFGYLSAVFAFAGFTYGYFSIDFMHVADLGVAQYVIGSILWELFLEVGGKVARSEEGCSIF